MIAEREIIDALEAAADEVYGPVNAAADEDEGGDIEDMLRRELEELNAAPARSQRFRVCKRDTACGGLWSEGQVLNVSGVHHRAEAARPDQAGTTYH